MATKEIPIYRVDLVDDDLSGIECNFIALVERPAIKREFLAFNEQAHPMKFSLNEDRRIISGAILLADTPIARVDPQTKEPYFAVFPKDTILRLAQKFFRKGYQQNVNIMHDSDQQVHSVTLFESFITDSSRGILPMRGFEDAKEGSWFGSMHVEDDNTWNRIKSLELRGFSIEGLFHLKQFTHVKAEGFSETPESRLDQIKSLLNEFKK
jgi:hypothetical protein